MIKCLLLAIIVLGYKVKDYSPDEESKSSGTLLVSPINCWEILGPYMCQAIKISATVLTNVSKNTFNNWS